MKTFKFTCKQNQVCKIVAVLNNWGKPNIEIKNGFPVVTLKHNGSNSAINKALYKAGVEGVTNKKNLKVVKCSRWELSEHIPENEWFIWVHKDEMKKVRYSYQETEYCESILIIHQKKNGKVFQI